MVNPYQPVVARDGRINDTIYRALAKKIVVLPMPTEPFVSVKDGRVTRVWHDILKRSAIPDLPSDESPVIHTVTGRLTPEWHRALTGYLET